jgi:hypothetical protein
MDGMRKYTDSLNGKSFHTFIKASEVPARLLRTNMLRRLSEECVLEYIRQTGEVFDIKLETAWFKLFSMGESWNDESLHATNPSLLKNTTRLRLIKGLPCAVNNSVYVQFLTSGWCRNSNDQFSYDGVSLQHFSLSDLSDVNLTKTILGDALRHFEFFLVFCFGDSYEGVTKELWDDLQYGNSALQKFSAEFIRYEIEFKLSSSFQVIKDTVYSSVTTHDITSYKGVRNFLKESIESIKKNITIERQLTSQSRRSIASPNPVVSPNPNPPSPSLSLLPCKYFFFNQLGVTDKANKLITCTANTCRYPHMLLSAVTIDTAKIYIEKWKLAKGKNGMRMPKKLVDKVFSALLANAQAFKP